MIADPRLLMFLSRFMFYWFTPKFTQKMPLGVPAFSKRSASLSEPSPGVREASGWQRQMAHW